jgi:hypothetical protein
MQLMFASSKLMQPRHPITHVRWIWMMWWSYAVPAVSFLQNNEVFPFGCHLCARCRCAHSFDRPSPYLDACLLLSTQPTPVLLHSVHTAR